MSVQSSEEVRDFVGRQAETDAAMAAISAESQAGLRQYSLERMMGYGVDYADAVELRGRILKGQDWQSSASALAETLLGQAEQAGSDPTRISCLRRASALLRMSQALMLSDSDDRRAIFDRAASAYAEAAALAGDCVPVEIAGAEKPLRGWLHQARGGAIGSVVVIGGIEGWAMDFAEQGNAFAARGIDALMIDGPGQGETRFRFGHFHSAQWSEAYGALIDYLDTRAPGRPIGFVGHSMGGSFAMAVANRDTRIKACVNNGGPFAPWMVPQGTTFFSKMIAYCGVGSAEAAVPLWELVKPDEKGPNKEYPLLMVQGGEDPLVTTQIGRMLYDNAPTTHKKWVMFSDGDHCIYRHKDDRDMLICDWMRETLLAGGAA